MADSSLWQSEARSIRLFGVATSIKMELMFWETLEAIAVRDSMTVPKLIEKLNEEFWEAGHHSNNFTSFLRVCCLRFLNLQVHDLLPKSSDVPISAAPAKQILECERSLSTGTSQFTN